MLAKPNGWRIANFLLPGVLLTSLTWLGIGLFIDFGVSLRLIQRINGISAWPAWAHSLLIITVASYLLFVWWCTISITTGETHESREKPDSRRRKTFANGPNVLECLSLLGAITVKEAGAALLTATIILFVLYLFPLALWTLVGAIPGFLVGASLGDPIGPYLWFLMLLFHLVPIIAIYMAYRMFSNLVG